MLELAVVLFTRKENGTNGSVAILVSTSAKANKRATPMASHTSVVPEPHGCVAVPTIA